MNPQPYSNPDFSPGDLWLAQNRFLV